ncbi:MAG: hypothetical protein KGZ69_15545 [Methylomonas sp.]|nr:hypothetical protein [Methylomonas sp.]
MKLALKHKPLLLIILSQFIVSGCANTQGNDLLKGAGLGALSGAALGCAIGLAAGGGSGCAKGAAIGAVSGAVVGWGTVQYQQYQASQVRSVNEDQRLYGLAKSVDTAQVKINKTSSTPSPVRPGGSVQISTDYSIRLPSTETVSPVSESWTLKKDGQVLAALPQQESQRASGGWNANAVIPIPSGAANGTYVIEHKVQSGNSYDLNLSTFDVIN